MVNLSCPACGQKQVKSRFSWRALLYAIFCFPCGIWCCLKRKTYFCDKCHCDVVETPSPTETSTLESKLGYNYRLYESTKTGLPAGISYRNEACSVSSDCSDNTTITTGSTSPIVSKD